MQMRMPDAATVVLQNDKAVCCVAPQMYVKDVCVSLAVRESRLQVGLTAQQSAVKYLSFRWNFSPAERREGVRVWGDTWERGHGEIEWRGIVPHRCMPWVCAVSNGSDADPDTVGRLTECFGVRVRPAALCFWQYDAAGVTLWCDVRCGGEGVLLGGRTVEVCSVVFGEYRDVSAFQALRQYYGTLCDDALLPPHKVYGSNNWYYAYGETSEQDILRDTELLVRCCEGLENRPYMVLDDGWQINRCDGPWDKLCPRFQDMKKLADTIRQKGARPGIWLRPLADREHQLDLPDECRCAWDNAYLDPSHPLVLQYVADTVRRLVCDWGYELIKHDFTTYDIFGCWGGECADKLGADGWHFYDRSKTGAEIATELYRVILEAADGKALILGCNVSGHLAAGLTHLNRTGGDTSGVDYERVRRYGVNTLAARMMQHEAFYHVDADCVGFAGKIDPLLNARWARLLSHSGTPFFASPKPSCVDQETERLLRECYARAAKQADTAVPLDWMENLCPARWLINGKQVYFDWYGDEGNNSFGG